MSTNTFPLSQEGQQKTHNNIRTWVLGRGPQTIFHTFHFTVFLLREFRVRWSFVRSFIRPSVWRSFDRFLTMTISNGKRKHIDNRRLLSHLLWLWWYPVLFYILLFRRFDFLKALFISYSPWSGYTLGWFSIPHFWTRV